MIDHIFQIIEESCLVPLLEDYLKNESLVEMERHKEIYYMVFQCLQVFSEVPGLHCLLAPLEAQVRVRGMLPSHFK